MTSHQRARKPNKHELSFFMQSPTYQQDPLLDSKEAITTRRAKTDYDESGFQTPIYKGRGIHTISGPLHIIKHLRPGY